MSLFFRPLVPNNDNYPLLSPYMPPTMLSTPHALSHLTSQNLWLKHYYYLQYTDEETKALRGLTWEERYSYWGMVGIWNHGFLPSEPKLSTLSYYGRILIFFNWNIVDFCFRCTAKWFSYIYLYIFIYICFFMFFPITVYYKILSIFPCYTIGSYCVSILHIVVCICYSQILNLSLPSFPLW